MEQYHFFHLTSYIYVLLQAGELQILVKHAGYTGANGLRIKTLELYGLDRLPAYVNVDGVKVGDRDIRSMNQVPSLK